MYLQNDSETLARLRARDSWVAQVAGKSSPPAGPTRPADYDQTVTQIKRRIQNLTKDGVDARETDQIQRLRKRLKQYQERFAEREAPVVNESATQAGQEEWIEEAFLRTVTRFPTDPERERSRQYLAESENPAEGLRDLLWALINTKEFIVNH